MGQPLDLSKAIPTISIVDDDEAVREGIEQLLQALGYNASTFGSAEEFLRSVADPQHIVYHHRSADGGIERP
jgi:FixJ family two-component response regulator